VLAAVHLRLDALPAMDGAIVERLRADKGVAAVAPLAFGDIARGYPVVGATAEFATRWGRHPPAEGRLFAAEDEAVVGADVALALGDVVVPSHAPHAAAEAAHRHEGAGARVIGRLPRFGSAWDRAILVPIEAVWEVHGLGNGHAEDGRIGPPFDAARVPPVPIAVVRPASVADAYALRQRYRQDGTMAVFPAEVLSELYRLTPRAGSPGRRRRPCWLRSPC
jgi:putative ABC transport system permease protein